MSPRERKPFVEEEPEGAPDWMLTFSDCMTLLLTFFVLLLTFSSFDEQWLWRLSGAFKTEIKSTIFRERQRIDHSLAPEVESVVDRTEEGAEKRTKVEVGIIKNPKAYEYITAVDAYHNERTFYLDADKLFLGKGSVLSGEGREYLEKIASFMKLVPCKIIIGQMGSGPVGPQSNKESYQNMQRSWGLVQFFTQQQKIEKERFYLTAEALVPSSAEKSRSLMRIILLTDDFNQ